MRFFSTTLTLAAIPATVLGAVFNITVGAGGMLAFNPSNITAGAGDVIHFEFQAKNHSVTQSTFTSPCSNAIFNNSAGANSGFLSIPPNTTFSNGTNPTWSISIKDTSPLWFHCAQTVPVSHCQKGMVFSINATPQKSFDMFLANAKASGSNSTSASSPAANGTAAPATVSQAASNTSGASKLVYTRGAAGLLTIVTIGAMLL